MKLGLVLGYWGARPPAQIAELAQEAEKLGFDSVWSAESWGSDAFSPLVWIAAQTSTIKLGTGVVQISARTPTATAMHALTLDHLSNGRVILGLGVSGPQVVEGWYGQPFGKPLARTREYVEIIRRVLAREAPLEFPGDHYQHPYTGPGSVGLGKPLKSITHPLRADIPIYLGAEGPKNVAMTAEIADGWLPLYYSPFRPEVYAESLARGEARLRDRGAVQLHHHRRHRRRADAVQGVARLLHRWHGRGRCELPQEPDGAHGLRVRSERDPAPLPRRQARRSDRDGAECVRGRDLARRAARADPRAVADVGGQRGHDAQRRRPGRRHDAADRRARRSRRGRRRVRSRVGRERSCPR